ncbi:protein FAM83H [Anguilla rostrata]|uniref:protein FAM83H n=1 Tax=Anguilla rostrata TaxID=7938 RepID=UPI0030CA643F
MAHRSQSSSLGDNPLDPNYLPPHYREEYRMAIDALVEDGMDGYCGLLQKVGVVDFLSHSEIEHIKSTVQAPTCSSQPDLPYQETDADGSSDTYWPVHSDLEAPGLDLGWPNLAHGFIGPTEVTTLVNPSDPETPSIKEHVRRLIKNAQQVIALVMDMFTDVDIFSDLLNATARHVPVYILLDEQNAHHFVAMVNNCKVNLDMFNLMRVRTVAGTTYFCRTGKSFKGQVMDRFLLTDCRAVLSGNYSFMWSFEKIHRCIAHLFHGELVTTFDEEFRILFAQSEPLVMENALVPLGSRDGNNFISGQFATKRSQSFRHPQGSLRDLSGYSFGDWIDTDRNMHPFRRDDSFRHSVEPSHMQFANNKFLAQQFRMERPYIDQSRPMTASRQIQDNAYKRHSYAEGTLESYSSARQFMKNRVMNNLDEMDSHGSYLQKEQHLYQGGGSASGQGLYNKMKSQSYHQPDEYSDSGYLLEGDPPGTYTRAVDYLSSGSSKEIKQNLGEAGRYSQTNTKRSSVGQPYACQSSPTQLHPPENKRLCSADDSERQQQDPSVKEGLRSWRINSFLSNIEDSGEEGLPQPMGPDAFDEPPQPPEGKLYGPEASVPRFSTRDHPKVPTKPELLPRFGKPVLPRAPKEPPPRDLGTSGSSSTTEGDKVEDAEISDPREITLTKHESFRSRVNPMLLRSSRLRSSLIFSSSKLEEHSSVLMKSGNNEEDSDRTKTSSIVAQILEKRRSLSREPYDWRKQKMTDIQDTSHAEVPESEEPNKVIESSKANPNEHALEGKPKVTEPVDTPTPTTSIATPSRKMSDPESRLSYFKDQIAKQKASRMAIESSVRSPEPHTKKPDPFDTPPDKTLEKPAISITPAEPILEPEVPTKTPVPVAKTSLVTVKPYEPEPAEKISSENAIKPVTDVMKKEVTKSLKPFPSPKAFKKEMLKPFKSTHSRHVSCGEEVFTDATDAEKSELKKSRSHSSSGLGRIEIGEKHLKKHGSSTSLNLVDGEGKALEFLKKQTQRLKGFLGTKGDKKAAGAASTDEKTNAQMSTVPEVSEEPAPKAHGGPQSPTRYQSSTSNVLYSSNLRDDTKVILEQISANSQKNRIEMAKQAEESKQGGDTDRKVIGKETEPSTVYHGRKLFQRAPSSNTQERDSLLKRIESLRKEKKVYSRFEMGNNLG